MEYPYNNTWRQCNDLPMPIALGQLLTEPETGELILLGGYLEGKKQNSIEKLSKIDGNCKLQKNTLQAKRHYSAFVSDNELSCKQVKIRHDEL